MGFVVYDSQTPAPVDVLYWPTISDLALWDWVCDFNLSHPSDPIVFRGMDVWDRPWEHFSKIQASGTRVGIDPLLLKSIKAFCPAYQSSSWPEIEIIFWRIGARREVLPKPTTKNVAPL